MIRGERTVIRWSEANVYDFVVNERQGRRTLPFTGGLPGRGCDTFDALPPIPRIGLGGDVVDPLLPSDPYSAFLRSSCDSYRKDICRCVSSSRRRSRVRSTVPAPSHAWQGRSNSKPFSTRSATCVAPRTSARETAPTGFRHTVRTVLSRCRSDCDSDSFSLDCVSSFVWTGVVVTVPVSLQRSHGSCSVMLNR